MAVALVLLVGAGLLIRSFARLSQVHPGFETRDAVTVRLSLPQQRYATDAQKAAFTHQAVQGLRALPGVLAVGAVQCVPLSGCDALARFKVEGGPPLAEAPVTIPYAITPEYFQAMGIPLLRGRPFGSQDVAGAPRVAIINQALASKFFPNQDPLGKRIAINYGPPGGPNDDWRQIVGVVGVVKHHELAVDGVTTLQTYEPFAQQPLDLVTFVVRTSASDSGLSAAVRATIRALDNNQPISAVRPLEQVLTKSVARQRFAMTLFAVFSGVALLLAAIGIYGVTSYFVAKRRTEIGIRMALGARPGQVMRLVFRQSGRLVGLGLLVGLLGAFALTRLLGKLLFGIKPHDPLTFATLAVLLALIAALACLLPARRATRIDPMAALRTD